MKLYTAQMNQWRRLKKEGRAYIDTTVKTGIKAFAPQWDMVMGVKQGTLTPEQYTERYEELMEFSEVAYEEEWEDLLSREEVILLCYCKPGDFCHRHLLAARVHRIQQRRGIDCQLCGEIL